MSPTPISDKPKSAIRQVVLLRHGESLWNQQNRFTGWTDVDLSDHGIEEGLQAGRALREHEFAFDVAFTSILTRAIRTLWFLLDAMDLLARPHCTDGFFRETCAAGYARKPPAETPLPLRSRKIATQNWTH